MKDAVLPVATTPSSEQLRQKGQPRSGNLLGWRDPHRADRTGLLLRVHGAGC